MENRPLYSRNQGKDKRMPGKNFIPRLSVDISQRQRAALDRLVPHGLRTPIFQALTDGIIEILSLADGEEERNIILGAMISRREGATAYDLLLEKDKE